MPRSFLLKLLKNTLLLTFCSSLVTIFLMLLIGWQYKLAGNKYFYENYGVFAAPLKTYVFTYFWADFLAVTTFAFSIFCLIKLTKLIALNKAEKFTLNEEYLFNLYNCRFGVIAFILLTSFTIFLYDINFFIVVLILTISIFFAKNGIKKFKNFLFQKILKIIDYEQKIYGEYFYFEYGNKDEIAIFFLDEFKFICTKLSSASYGVYDFSNIQGLTVDGSVITITYFDQNRNITFTIFKTCKNPLQAYNLYQRIKNILDTYHNYIEAIKRQKQQREREQRKREQRERDQREREQRERERKNNYQNSGSDNLTLSEAFKLLGVTAQDDFKQVKKARLKLAHKHHPDKIAKNASAEEQESAKKKMQKINEAYELICKNKGWR